MEYDSAVQEHKWGYKLSYQWTNTNQVTRDNPDRGVPPFSPEAFLEYLVRFVVVDDQVSPDILYCFTHKSLVDSCRRMPRILTLMFTSSRVAHRR